MKRKKTESKKKVNRNLGELVLDLVLNTDPFEKKLDEITAKVDTLTAKIEAASKAERALGSAVKRAAGRTSRTN